MQLGSKEHKAQVCTDLVRQHYENIWKDEIALMEFDVLLGSLRTEKAAIELKLERGEYPKANDGKKELARKEAEIESTEAAIEGKKGDIDFWIKRITLIMRYAEKEGVQISD